MRKRSQVSTPKDVCPIPDCGKPLFRSPGGVTCENGHGGVVSASEGLPWKDDTLPNSESTLAFRAKTVGNVNLKPGERIRYTHGKETYSPVKYHTIEIGPFSVEVVIGENETADDALVRAMVTTKAMFQAEYDLRINEFRDRIFKMSQAERR